MQITHTKIPTEEDKVTLEDWIADHNIEGGGTFKLPQLIEEKTLSAGTTTVTFSNLDGDNDKEYYIIGDVFIVSGGGDRIITIKPNNITTNQAGIRVYHFNYPALDRTSISTLQFAMNGWGADSYCHSEAKLIAETGKPRLYSNHTIDGIVGSYKGGQMIKAEWNENSTNITSLVFAIDGGSFSGTIKLYKMVDITL